MESFLRMPCAAGRGLACSPAHEQALLPSTSGFVRPTCRGNASLNRFDARTTHMFEAQSGSLRRVTASAATRDVFREILTGVAVSAAVLAAAGEMQTLISAFPADGQSERNHADNMPLYRYRWRCRFRQSGDMPCRKLPGASSGLLRTRYCRAAALRKAQRINQASTRRRYRSPSV